MAQQTAVNWLVEQLLIYGDKAFNKEITLGQYHVKKQELIEQAKQMEMEQHGKTWLDSTTQFANDARMDSPINFDDYYNETYGNNSKQINLWQ